MLGWRRRSVDQILTTRVIGVADLRNEVIATVVDQLSPGQTENVVVEITISELVLVIGVGVAIKSLESRGIGSIFERSLGNFNGTPDTGFVKLA